MNAKRLRLFAIAALSLSTIFSSIFCSFPTRIDAEVTELGHLVASRPLVAGEQPSAVKGNLLSLNASSKGSELPPKLNLPRISLRSALQESEITAPGEALHFSLVIKNLGATILTNLYLESRFDPRHLSFQSASPAPDGVREDQQLIWENLLADAKLYPGQSLSLEVIFSALPLEAETSSVATRIQAAAVAGDQFGGRSPEVSTTATAWISPHPTPENQPPSAVIKAPGIGTAGSAISFGGDGSTDQEGPIASYGWTFGDEKSGSGKTITHTFKLPGTYNVVLRVVDSGGLVGEASHKIVISAPTEIPNQPPTARISAPTSAAAGAEVAFKGSGSTDPDGEIVAYQWTFGDESSSTAANPGHVFSKAGSYLVTLKVTDNRGATHRVSHSLVIEGLVNQAPKPIIVVQECAEVGEEVYFRGDESWDPDGEIVSYKWTFGDGSSQEGMNVIHAYAAPGTYVVKLKVGDNRGANASKQVNLVVEIKKNDPPQPFIILAESAKVGETVEFSGRESWDPDGEIIYYKWYFGDGAIKEGINVSHSYSTPGTYTVKLKVKDNDLVWAETTRTITISAAPTNIPPEARIFSSSSGMVGMSVEFYGGESWDPDGEIVSYKWFFGDETTSSEANTVHAYSSPGSYMVKLRVTDNLGATDEVTHLITISAAGE